MVALPRGIRPPEMRRYSRSGILLIIRAGVKREKSPRPPPPGPVPDPPAPVPLPAVAAPEVEALPVDGTRDATIGVLAGTTILGGGATTGVGNAFLPAAPSFSFARSGVVLGGGGGGGGGGTSVMSYVRERSMVVATLRTSSPDRIAAPSATWTASTPASALMRS